ncbi:MAG: enoyl-CoA hydratase/isomerase family protein [Candidatus Micrarchaeota archaeon]|nr:enoyl-CoA hydratase/isomerase family protein [Candidatus Micrarchaeota archaeon]
MKYRNILVKSEGPVAVITLNRPDKLNSIDRDMLQSLSAAVDAVAKDKSCRAVIITGSGNKSFCTGADINYLSSLKTERDAARFVDKVHSVFDRIEGMGKPVIAAVNGYCLGGGCELAMACDIRIATPDSMFGQPEVKLGILPGGGGTYRLPALIGIGRAKEMILAGDTISADTAMKIGLVNRIVASGSVVKEAKSIALKMNQGSYNAVKNAKWAVNANTRLNNAIEKKGFLACFGHADRKEGISAFLEHRKPRFK